MTPEQAKALREKFPRESIGRLPKGGQMLDFVGHAAVTDRLLAVDPGWTWEPLALDEHGLPSLDRANNLWIKLTICGVTRLGVGDGKTAKEAIGDAIRNAAMRFGVALDLWAKEDLLAFDEAAKPHSAVSAPAPPESHPFDDEPPFDGTTGEILAEPASLAQIKKIQIEAKERGVTERDHILDDLGGYLAKSLNSSKELTKVEASRVLNDIDVIWPRKALAA